MARVIAALLVVWVGWSLVTDPHGTAVAVLGIMHWLRMAGSSLSTFVGSLGHGGR